jgi:hypothetical protein
MAPSVPLKIRVVSVERCQQANCSVGLAIPSLKEFHLVVTRKEVELEQGVAAAVSYTWGEFEREKNSIGHLNNGGMVRMELGKEWQPRLDFMRKLVDLTKEFSALWIDQLCMPQRGDAVRATLAKIPVVYASLDVQILLPGNVCTCVPDWLRNHKLLERVIDGSMADDLVQREVWGKTVCAEDGSPFLDKMSGCINSMGISSYFERVWTLQELRSAARFQAHWVSAQSPQCCSWVEAIHEVHHGSSALSRTTPYLRLVIRRMMDDGWDVRAIQRAVKDFVADRVRAQLLALVEPHGYDGLFGAEGGLYVVCRFILGIPIQVPLRNGPDFASDNYIFDEFWNNLLVLARGKREASDPTDYVLAVWPGCPGYKIPHDYKSRDVTDLLEEAILCLETTHNKSLPVLAPSGLFDPHLNSGTGLYRPTVCLKNMNISDAGVLYRRFIGIKGHMKFPIPHGGHQKIVFADGGITHESSSLSTHALDLADVLDGLSDMPLQRVMNIIKQAWCKDGMPPLRPILNGAAQRNKNVLPALLKLCFMILIIRSWPLEFRTEFASLVSRHERHTTQNGLAWSFRTHLSNIVNKVDDYPDYWDGKWQMILHPDLDYSEQMYQIVTGVLGLDHGACRTAGLRMMLTESHGPVVGISRHRYPSRYPLQFEPEAPQTQPEPNHGVPSALSIYAHGNATVWACYEADLDDKNARPPTYRVSGAWVCSKSIDIDAQVKCFLSVDPEDVPGAVLL